MPPTQPRRRSNSLPIPQIEISLYQGGSGNSRDSPSNSSLTNKDYIEVPDQPPPVINEVTLQTQKSIDKTEDPNSARRPSKKRVKMADLRTLIETKILSKSDRGLEKIGADGKGLQHAVRVFYFFCLDCFQKSFSCPLCFRTSTEASTQAMNIFHDQHQTYHATNHQILSKANQCHRLGEFTSKYFVSELCTNLYWIFFEFHFIFFPET